MKTIVTKFVGPTNTKGARIIAKAEGVPSVTIGYHSVDGNPHAVAAKKLKDKMGWSGKMVGGGLPNGDMAWVFKDDVEINPSRRKHMKKNPLKERIAAARHARSIRRKPGGRALARSVIAYGRGRGLLSKNPALRTPRYKAAKSGDYWKVWDNRQNRFAEGPPHINKATATKYARIMNSTMKKNPRKRTSKKKLSPKQAAWRKEFARRVKAGLFKKSAARARRGFTFHKNPKPRKISRRALRVSIKKAWNRGLSDVAHYPKKVYLKDATDFGRRKRVPFKNPVRSKLLCLKNRAGKWWYLKNAGSALHGPELTDDKTKARRFATDNAAMQVASKLKSVLAANGFVTAKTH